MSNTPLHWIVCGLSLAALAAPATAQTTGRNAFATGGFAAIPTGTTTTTSTGPTSSTTTSTMDPSTLPVEWQEIIAIAESLIEEFDLTFDHPWEEAFFILMVARIHMQLTWWNQFQGGGTGAVGGSTSIAGGGTAGSTATFSGQSTGTAVAQPFATGGFGARRR